MDILVFNAGSSSLKYALIDSCTGQRRLSGLAERLGTPEAVLETQGQTIPLANATVDQVVDQLLAVDQLTPEGIGHRVVHGGEYFSSATLIDEQVLATIADCAHLAPLHNPANLAGIVAMRTAFPHVPQVAVCDTAFHQTMPAEAYRYAVPDQWYSEHGVRRYGFHGTSHRFVAQRAAELLRQPLERVRLITAHLGNGCSACAVRDGISVDTTMGLTPLEGLVMGTRSGDLDPGIITYVMQATGRTAQQVTDDLNRRSGLLGLSGTSNDMRALCAASAAGDARAALAIEVFCYRLAKAIAALAVPLGRLDALVFTGGIGQHSVVVRSKTLALLGILGLREDPTANAAHGRMSEGRITSAGIALVIATDEELTIARDTAAVISNISSSVHS